MEKIDILSLTPEVLGQHLAEMGEPKFRAKQLFSWLHQKQVTEFDQMTTLSLQLRQKLNEKFCINRLNIARRLASSTDYHHGKSLCISTQVGCRMGCQFCASTIAGYVRDLMPSELLLQIYETQRDSGCRIDSIVLMGIGEPLDNFENVVQFFRILSHPDGMQMSLRHVALSTCGLVPRIRQLADLRLGVTLSVSLHSPENQHRSEIMPINRRYPVEELLDACRYYFDTTGRRVTIEYAVINGVNNTRADALQLARRLRGMQCHVNLIPVNPIRERSFRSFRKDVERFQRELTGLGINATIRRTLGSDIQAACGQLRRDADQQKQTAAETVKNESGNTLFGGGKN